MREFVTICAKIVVDRGTGPGKDFKTKMHENDRFWV